MSNNALDDVMAALDMNKTLKTCGARDTHRNAAKILSDATSGFVDNVASAVTTVAAATEAGNALVNDEDTITDGETCMGDNDVEFVAQMDAAATKEADAAAAETKKKTPKKTKPSDAVLAELDSVSGVVVVHEADEDVLAAEGDDDDDDDDRAPPERASKRRAVAREASATAPTHSVVAANPDEERDELLDKQQDMLASVSTQESRDKQTGSLARYVAVVLFDYYNGQSSSQTNLDSLFGTLCAHAGAGERETMTKKKRLLMWKPRDVLDNLMYIVGTINDALSVAQQCDGESFLRCIDLLLNVDEIKTIHTVTNNLGADEKHTRTRCQLLDRDMKMDDTRQLFLKGASVTRHVFVCRHLAAFVHAVHVLRTLPSFICSIAKTRQPQLARKIKPGETTWVDAIEALIGDRAKKTNLMDRTFKKLCGALQVLYQSGKKFDKASAAANSYDAYCHVEEHQRDMAAAPMLEDDGAVSDDAMID